MIRGFTNGCFDLFHEGHRHFLAECRKQCDTLIVAINDDASVRRLKGWGRPVEPLARRMMAVHTNADVDQSLPFRTEWELHHHILRIVPDIIFKGADYKAHDVVGSDVARVVLIPLLPGFSTTAAIEKMHA